MALISQDLIYMICMNGHYDFVYNCFFIELFVK